jgi:hypothetical protein
MKYLALNTCDSANIPAKRFATLEEAQAYQTPMGGPNVIVTLPLLEQPDPTRANAWVLGSYPNEAPKWFATTQSLMHHDDLMKAGTARYRTEPGHPVPRGTAVDRPPMSQVWDGASPDTSPEGVDPDGQAHDEDTHGDREWIELRNEHIFGMDD